MTAVPSVVEDNGTYFVGLQSSGQTPSLNVPLYPHFQEMIEVYNGDTYVRKIPLEVLIRFSGTAYDEFKPNPITKSRNATDRNTSTNPLVTESPSIDSVVESYPTCETFDFASTEEKTESSPHANDLETAFSRWKTMCEQLASISNPRCLYLNINAPYNPTHHAIEMALKWMLDNARTPDDEQCIPFGPPQLEQIDLLGLLEIYQAAVAFRLRPFPVTLRRQIMVRVSKQPPKFWTIKQFAAYIPVQDPIMVRLITSHDRWYRQCYYTNAELMQLDAFLRSYPALAAKFDEIFDFQAKQARRIRDKVPQLAESTCQGEPDQAQRCEDDHADMALEKAKRCAEAGIPSADQSQTSWQDVDQSTAALRRFWKAERGRRTRRQQQLKDKARAKSI